MNGAETMRNERPLMPNTTSDEPALGPSADAWEERDRPQVEPAARDDAGPHRRSWFGFDRWFVMAEQEDDFVLA